MMGIVTPQQQMDYLRRYRGLIGVRSKVPVKDSAMLSLIYTPGVAEVCRAIVADPLSSYTYTCRGNTVALVSNASGLFGLKGAPPEADHLQDLRRHRCPADRPGRRAHHRHG
jgi:malate dehydrogenase (oxaloacetate-decarboxylating)